MKDVAWKRLIEGGTELWVVFVNALETFGRFQEAGRVWGTGEQSRCVGMPVAVDKVCVCTNIFLSIQRLCYKYLCLCGIGVKYVP